MRTDNDTVQKAYEALKAAQEWLGRFEQHAPLVFGGEAELGQQIDSAILALEGREQKGDPNSAPKYSLKMTFKQAFEEEAETFFQAAFTNHFPIMRGKDWIQAWGENDPDLQEECDVRGAEIYNSAGALVYYQVRVKC